MKVFFFFCACLITATSFAQLPKTEIWVFDLKQGPAGYTISNPTKVKVGTEYNNQPWFTQDGEQMYFVSNKKAGGNTDIFKYDFRKKKRQIKQITKTKSEAEYSPRLTPDGERISCVRVAKDTVTQNLCTYNLKGKDADILFPQIKTFGYYCWKNQIELLAFHVSEPFSLQRHNLPKKIRDTLATNIGRCMYNHRGHILYIDKTDTNNYQLKELNQKHFGNRSDQTIEADKVLSETLEGEEDFAILKSKDLLMGKDGFIYIKENIFTNPGANWKPLFDMNHYKIYNFYRIAVSPVGNRIAVVAYVGDKP